MPDKWPVVVRWDEQALDLKDPQERFRRSSWNYFLVDQQAGVLIGYWLAEQGSEDLGSDAFDEVLHVIEGALYVHCEGAEHRAGPGDTVVVRRGRPLRLEAREPVRALFVCYPLEDAQGYEAGVRRAMAAKGLSKEVRA
jgi:uncharacterized cupin superfamily protein